MTERTDTVTGPGGSPIAMGSAPTADVDELDRRLIRELQRDGRVAIAELARRLDVARTTVQDRLKGLEERGVVRGYVPVLDHAKLGNPVTAIILVGFEGGHRVGQKELARRMVDIEGVEEVHLISGEWDIVLKVRAPSIEGVGELVVENLRRMEGVARTVTCASFHSVQGTP